MRTVRVGEVSEQLRAAMDRHIERIELRDCILEIGKIFRKPIEKCDKKKWKKKVLEMTVVQLRKEFKRFLSQMRMVQIAKLYKKGKFNTKYSIKLVVEYIKRKRLDYVHVLQPLMYEYYVSNGKYNNNTLNFLHKFKLIFHCVSVKKSIYRF